MWTASEAQLHSRSAHDGLQPAASLSKYQREHLLVSQISGEIRNEDNIMLDIVQWQALIDIWLSEFRFIPDLLQ